MPSLPKQFQGKPELGLIPRDALIAWARVLTFGARKYARWDWTRGREWSQDLDAALRHVHAWAEGEDLDTESGLSHLGHAICDLGFLVVFQARGIGHDDRHRWPAAPREGGKEASANSEGAPDTKRGDALAAGP